MISRQISFKFILIILTLFVLMFADLMTGHTDIPFGNIIKFLGFSYDSSGQYYILIKEFRFPRVFIAMLAGASLSVSGLVMQTIFRNPLAGPYVLGVSSGASLGVAFVVLSTGDLANAFSNSYQYILLLAAGAGAAAVLGIILAVSLRVRDILSILIVGILIAGVVSSIVSILQYYASDMNVKSFVVWTMGSLSSVSYKDISLIWPIVAVCLLVVLSLSKKLNLILPGESFAKSMGVNIKTFRIICFACVSILTGVVTAYCGPLGFIGIAAPHVSRWIFNTSNHFVLIPASIIIGSIFMLSGDLLSHAFMENGVLPINAITAILGAPFIIWIVIKNKRTMV